MCAHTVDPRAAHRIIDLSGFMFSGKAAVSDLLREFSGVHVANYRQEFDLLRLGGGLIDLKNAVMDWSPVRSYAALHRFERRVRQVAASPGRFARLFTTGYGYQKRYPEMIDALEDFLQAVTALGWETPWPYEDLDDGPRQTFWRKIRAKLGRHDNREYVLVSRESFISAAQEFVRRLAWSGVDRSSFDTLVIHNALEPFTPGRNLDLLGPGARCIIVDRDPRDIYATAVTTQQGFNDNLRLYRRIAGAHDVRVFIERYKIYRKNVDVQEEGVLRIMLEELVQQYEPTLQRIRSFLGLDGSRHIRKGEYFKPEQSARNVGMWRCADLSAFSADFAAIAAECNE